MGRARHVPFLAGIGAGAAGVALMVALDPDLAVSAGAVAFFSVYLLLTAFRLPAMDSAFLRGRAEDADEPVAVIFLVTVCAIVISLVSLFAIINREGATAITELAVAFGSVALGWLTIHTMAAIHYARLYWRAGADGVVDGGIDFPGTADPEGYDFLYFSFVVGMTAQTADSAVTSTAMRKIVLFHGVVSFFFNTVLVAVAVNAAVTLAA